MTSLVPEPQIDEDDCEEVEEEEYEAPGPNLRTEFGLACPRCGAAERLTLGIRCSAKLDINGSEAFGDHFWDDTDFCVCDECRYEATVADFRVADGEEVRP